MPSSSLHTLENLVNPNRSTFSDYSADPLRLDRAVCKDPRCGPLDERLPDQFSRIVRLQTRPADVGSRSPGLFHHTLRCVPPPLLPHLHCHLLLLPHCPRSSRTPECRDRRSMGLPANRGGCRSAARPRRWGRSRTVPAPRNSGWSTQLHPWCGRRAAAAVQAHGSGGSSAPARPCCVESRTPRCATARRPARRGDAGTATWPGLRDVPRRETKPRARRIVGGVRDDRSTYSRAANLPH
jgi:hypothetical protein